VDAQILDAPTGTRTQHRIARTVTGLRCRVCGDTEPTGPVHVCATCFGPLAPVLEAVPVSREIIEAGPASLWRYAPMLPVLEDGPIPDDLAPGWTPLVPAPRLAERLGIAELWLKDDTRNPSGSFKDRVVAVALAAARSFGIDTIACASTGNLANAVAAAGANAGLRTVVFIPSDLERAKIVTSAVYGATIVAIDGTYDDVNRLCAEVADDRGWGFVNVNLRPYYAEGSKTLGFEVAEQLGWELPDHVVVPVASGAQLVNVTEAFAVLRERGLVEPHATRISGAQAAGCAPVATAFAAGADHIEPVKPDTIARSLAIGNPADGWAALRAVRETGGAIEAVTDEEVVAGIQLLGETEGIFAETAGGVTIATLARLARSGTIRPDERVVAMITGHGLKTAEVLTDRLGPSITIEPSLGRFDAAIDALVTSTAP
jgi:threonine synthase